MDNNFSSSLLSTLPYAFAPSPNNNSYARITFTYQYKPYPHGIIGAEQSDIYHFGNAYLDISEEDKNLTLDEIKNRILAYITRLTKSDGGSDITRQNINIIYNLPCKDFGGFGGTT